LTKLSGLLYTAKKKSPENIAIFFTIIFIILRLLTGGINFIGFPFVGLIILSIILTTDHTWGFILILFDMSALGEQVSVTSWQIGTLARFSDLEFIILIIYGIINKGYKFHGFYFKKLVKPYFYLFIIIIAQVIYSFFFSNLIDPLRVSRTLFYNSIIFFIPSFIRNITELKKIIVYLFLVIVFTTFIDFLGFVINNPALMTPFNTGSDIAGKVWREAAESFSHFRIYGGIGYAGYDKPFSFVAILFFFSLVINKIKTSNYVKVVFILAIILELLSLSRSFIGGMVIAFIAILFLDYQKKGKFGYLLKIILSSLIITIIFFSISETYFINTLTERFSNIFLDITGKGQGTVALRINYFQSALDIMKNINGNIFNGIGFRMLPSKYGVIFNIGQSNLSEFQSSGQLIQTTSLDSGWANVFWTMGVIGIGFFIWFIYYYLRISYKIFFHSTSVPVKILASTLFALFAFFPFAFLGTTLLYGKDITFIFQFMLTISVVGLAIDYSTKSECIK